MVILSEISISVKIDGWEMLKYNVDTMSQVFFTLFLFLVTICVALGTHLYYEHQRDKMIKEVDRVLKESNEKKLKKVQDLLEKHFEKWQKEVHELCEITKKEK